MIRQSLWLEDLCKKASIPFCRGLLCRGLLCIGKGATSSIGVDAPMEGMLDSGAKAVFTRLPFSTAERWRRAQSVAQFCALLERIADIEADETKNVPEDSRTRFWEGTASIRKNRCIASVALPIIDRWIASRSTPADAH